jgi:hypothetical protein
VVGAQGLFADLEGALQEGLGGDVVPLEAQEFRQIIEGDGDGGMLRAQGRFIEF